MREFHSRESLKKMYAIFFLQIQNIAFSWFEIENIERAKSKMHFSSILKDFEIILTRGRSKKIEK